MKIGSMLCFAAGVLVLGAVSFQEMEDRRAKMQGMSLGIALTLIGLTLYRLSRRLDE